jgi:shikimate dehydrogenase
MTTGFIKLGLIGDNIKPSRSPHLHRLAGRLCGLSVSYDLLIPQEMGMDFDDVLAHCASAGYRGVNVTYPYKERAVNRAEIGDPLVRRIGAVNTLVFDAKRVLGYNTDYTGFTAAFVQRFGNMTPGAVAMIGAGGVGRAVAFGLLALGASGIRIVDRDPMKADALAASLNGAGGGVLLATSHHDAATAMNGADGVINCTPVGMAGQPGSPVPPRLLAGCKWAFEAVYTPVQTQFKSDAELNGLQVLSGYELFFNQGVQAFRIFTGKEPGDLGVLRDLLISAD